MKRTLVEIASLVVLPSVAFAVQVEYGMGVFSPKQGVACDREGNFCTSAFVLQGGVMCTVETQSCATHGKVNKTSKKSQKMVFGK